MSGSVGEPELNRNGRFMLHVIEVLPRTLATKHTKKVETE